MIVQPWFTAIGHPAQTTVHAARILAGHLDAHFLISEDSRDNKCRSLADKLQNIAQVASFPVHGMSIRSGTCRALRHLVRLSGGGNRYESIFFLDAHLVTLAGLWPFFAALINPRRLSVLYLAGPERILAYLPLREIVRRFLTREEIRLFLRTEELAEAWCSAFHKVPDGRISVLPSLELPEGRFSLDVPAQTSSLRFGILGQIRIGKGIDWLVPLFSNYPGLGILTIAGTFYNERQREEMGVLEGSANFIDRFLSEEEIDRLAGKQHYLLMLYDKWDPRMEGATLYLAARTNRPVIVYEEGWCGRIVRTYGCGQIAPRDRAAMPGFFSALPRPGDAGYAAFLEGLEKFRRANSGEAVRRRFIEQLTGDNKRNVY